jgi:hypothetical protein
MINQLVYLHDTYQMVQTLNNQSASPEQKNAARNSFYTDFALNTVGTALLPLFPGAISEAGELTSEGSELLLTGMESLYGDDVYRDQNKRARVEQTRHQPSVLVKSATNSGGGGGGIYAYPAPTKNPVSSGRSSGGNFVGLSGSQQSAVQSLTSAISAKNFDAKEFVNSLQNFMKAFEIK